jgi:hypothetical protein
VNQNTTWTRFVERRCRELHNEFPCATPTNRDVCPKHRTRVPQHAHITKTVFSARRDDWVDVRVHVRLTGICKRCHDELYQQLAAEYPPTHRPQGRLTREENMSNIVTIDWDLAEAVAARLGPVTRRLVADRDCGLAREWAQRMRVSCTDQPAAMSYLELVQVLDGCTTWPRKEVTDDAA